MATPVFCCGFECGVEGTGNQHVNFEGTGTTFDTTTVRTGLRSIRTNPAAAIEIFRVTIASGTRVIGRIYSRFASLPTANLTLISFGSAVTGPGVRFNQSDSKLYASVGTTIGATGVAVTTGIQYRIDFDFNINTAGNDTSDAQIDGSACGQATAAGLNIAETRVYFGNTNTTGTFDAYWDDLILSITPADYPLGAGHGFSSIPNADGTHNVAGANDFERTLTGTDITNATTDAFELVNDRPLPTTAVDFINGVAPPNPGDYVELDYEAFTGETDPPNGVDAIVVYHDAGGAGTNIRTITLRDNGGGTSANIHSASTNVGATISYARAHFATIPGGGAWTLAAANALRSRFLVTDASPDPYIDALMLEADFPDAGGDGNLTLQSVGGVASVSNLVVGTPRLTLQSVAGVASLNNLEVATPANLSLGTVAGIAALPNVEVATPGNLVLQAVAGVASLNNIDIVIPAVITLQAVAGVASLPNVELAAPAPLSLGAVAGVASVANVEVGTPRLNLQAVAGVASLPNVEVASPGNLTLQAVAGVANLTNVDVASPANLSLGAVAGIANLPNLEVAAPATLALDPIAGIATLPNVTIDTAAFLDLQAVAGVASLANVIVGTPKLNLDAVAGVASLANVEIASPANLSLDPVAGVASLSNVTIDTPEPPSGGDASLILKLQ